MCWYQLIISEETGYSIVMEIAVLLPLREALETTDFDKHQIAGLISDLDQKGVLYIEYRHPDGSEGPDLLLSEDFINSSEKTFRRQAVPVLNLSAPPQLVGSLFTYHPKNNDRKNTNTAPFKKRF